MVYTWYMHTPTPYFLFFAVLTSMSDNAWCSLKSSCHLPRRWRYARSLAFRLGSQLGSCSVSDLLADSAIGFQASSAKQITEIPPSAILSSSQFIRPIG